MKTTLLIVLLGGTLAAAAATQSITGVITDSMCGASHAMMKGHADDDCVKMCVKHSADYALYDGKTIWKLSDQKTPASFIAKRVKVTGTVDEKAMQIKVTKIEPAE
jgi:hypothetical protein